MEDRRESTGGESKIEYEKQFRTSMFGFHKDDVISCLERLERARRKEGERYAARIHELETDLARSRASQDAGVAASENEALRSENELLRLRIADLEAGQPAASESPGELPSEAVDALRLSEESGESCDAAGLAEADPQELMARLEESEHTRERLEEKLREYELEKNRLCQIEEEAHRRARAIEVEAQDRVSALHDELAQKAAVLRSSLDELSSHIDDISRAIYSELSASGTRYAALRQETDELRTLLDRFPGAEAHEQIL